MKAFENWIQLDFRLHIFINHCDRRFSFTLFAFTFVSHPKHTQSSIYLILVCHAPFPISLFLASVSLSFLFARFVVNLQYVTNKCKQRWLHHNSQAITEEKTVCFTYHIPATQKISFISFIQPLNALCVSFWSVNDISVCVFM